MYCILREYEPARQALLQALKLDRGTDDALTLLDLLQLLQKPANGGMPPVDSRRRIEERLERRAKAVMDRLRA